MKAQSTIQNLDDEKYFHLLERLFEANVSAASGILYLSEKDLTRMPETFKKNVLAIAKSKGGLVEISAEPQKIESGFILAYGDIEENCTIKSLFMANTDRLKDIANEKLFGALD
jgi:V/A-type H+-transporting ATPase subunit E